MFMVTLEQMKINNPYFHFNKIDLSNLQKVKKLKTTKY